MINNKIENAKNTLANWKYVLCVFLLVLAGCSPRTEFDYWQYVEPEDHETEMDMGENISKDSGENMADGSQADSGDELLTCIDLNETDEEANQ